MQELFKEKLYFDYMYNIDTRYCIKHTQYIKSILINLAQLIRISLSYELLTLLQLLLFISVILFFLGNACFHCSRDQRFQSWKIRDSLSNTPKEIPQIRESGKASGELSQRSHQGELFYGGKRPILCARLRRKTILCEHQPERFSYYDWWDVLH